MKIAVMAPRFPELSQTFVLSQITGLLERGHDVHIIATPGDDGGHHPAVAEHRLMERMRPLSVPPRPLGQRVLKAAGLFGRLLLREPGVAIDSVNVLRHGRGVLSLTPLYDAASLVGDRDYDVIYCHFGTVGRRADRLRAAGGLRGPIVTVFHAYEITEYLRHRPASVFHDLFRRGELFLPISERWRDLLIRLGCPVDRTRVHRMGVRTDQIPFRERVRQPSQPIQLLSVARLVEKKGIEYAIRAAADAAARGVDVDYRIIGGGPLHGRLQALIDELDAADSVRLLGGKTQDEVQELLAWAHIFVAPSVTSSEGDQEGIPVAIMEAMAAGLPIISTRHSGIPELVEDGGVRVPGSGTGRGDLDAAYPPARHAERPLARDGSGGAASCGARLRA